MNTAPTVTVRAPTSPSVRPAGQLRPRPHSASSIPNTLHHQLLNVGQRSRSQDRPHEFHDAVFRADTAPKSIRTFKGHAIGILRQLFFALLVKFLLVAIVAVGLTGGAAWYVWAHRGDGVSSLRSRFSLYPSSW